MGSKRQPTLKESWSSYDESTSDVGRGRGTETDHANPGEMGMCANKGGRRGGRSSRGRGRAASLIGAIILDDEDESCQQAVGQFELENSDVAKAFAATTVATELPGFDKMAGVEPQCSKMNIVLTSERSDDGEMLIDNLHSSEDADPDFTKPAPKKGLATKASIKASKQEHKVNTEKPCSKSNNSSSSSCNRLSLDTYFSSENSSLLPGSSKTSCVPIPELEMEEIQEFLMTDEHPGDPMDLSDDFNLMCNILDIQEPSKTSTSPSYFVPKFKLRTQDEKPKSQVPVNHFEFHQCLKDIYSQSVCPVEEKCPCGNVYNDLMDFQESDPVIQTKLLAEPVHPHNNEEMKSTFQLPSFVPSPSLNSESKEASSIIIENDKSGTDITLDLDIGFLLDENDPIFDDKRTGEGGDALDKPEETVNVVEKFENTIISLSNRSMEKQCHDATHINNGSSTASNKEFELSITKVTKKGTSCSAKLNPVRKGNKISRAELRELFKDDTLLFGDGDSTVSNEEFDTPIKGSESDLKIETITDTQQVRYVQSVRDMIHVPRGRIERPLEPKTADTTMNISGNEYERDSFCVADDDVEFMEISTFTQAMNDARDELDREDELEKPKRQTRYRKKTTGLQVKPEAENSKLFVSSKELSSKKRRRIISFSDSSDDD